MSPAVSVPEKTLEHWSSQYVTHRFKTKAAQWWPASGEDIDIRWLPTRPGKAVQLELKTTKVAGAGLHDVVVDLGQLWDYRQRPPGRQPFYAFPWPNWRGNLTTAAIAKGRPVTEFGFRRSGSPWWFAGWMVLLTAAEVAAVLRTELAAHGSRKRGETRRLARFDLSHSMTTPVVTWGSGAVRPTVVGWREFWSELGQCGRPGWPQLIRLPARTVQARDIIPHSQVVGMLQEAAGMLAQGIWDEAEPFVTLEPDEDGNYRIAATPADDFSRSPDDETDQPGDHRQIVFLDGEALFRTR